MKLANASPPGSAGEKPSGTRRLAEWRMGKRWATLKRRSPPQKEDPLLSRGFSRSGRRDSNPRPSPWQKKNKVPATVHCVNDVRFRALQSTFRPPGGTQSTQLVDHSTYARILLGWREDWRSFNRWTRPSRVVHEDECRSGGGGDDRIRCRGGQQRRVRRPRIRALVGRGRCLSPSRGGCVRHEGIGVPGCRLAGSASRRAAR